MGNRVPPAVGRSFADAAARRLGVVPKPVNVAVGISVAHYGAPIITSSPSLPIN